MSATPTLDRLTELVRQLHSLTNDAHPGLVSWQIALHERVKELVEWWTETENAELSAVTKERDELRAALAKVAKAIECEPEKLLAGLKGDDA